MKITVKFYLTDFGSILSSVGADCFLKYSGYHLMHSIEVELPEFEKDKLVQLAKEGVAQAQQARATQAMLALTEKVA